MSSEALMSRVADQFDGISDPRSRIPRLKLLFLCTAHNSLSQRLYLSLKDNHDIYIEFALTEDLMISAAELAEPDLIICPFLTRRVPKELCDKYMTLIVHPGPPGDGGPSSLDWVIMGDDGSAEDADLALRLLDQPNCGGRSFWGTSVLQATEDFDAGPTWAWDQFPIDIDAPGVTKSTLYRGVVTLTAVRCVGYAIQRILDAAANEECPEAKPSPGTTPQCRKHPEVESTMKRRRRVGFDAPHFNSIHPKLRAHLEYGKYCIGAHKSFLGGQTRYRPLLKSSQRNFDITRHSAQIISRRIRASESQPGVLSGLFGASFYVYGGIVEDSIYVEQRTDLQLFAKELFTRSSLHEAPKSPTMPVGRILGVRHFAICLSTVDNRGIWITQVRQPKRKNDAALWPKARAIVGLIRMGLIPPDVVTNLEWPISYNRATCSTFQEIIIEYVEHDAGMVANVSFDFYNGAMTTDQCRRLLEALQQILRKHITSSPIVALVLMGGSYFSNGIALNTIESAASASDEAWASINAMNDVAFCLLYSCSAISPPIRTIAAIRGNAAAGGVALPAACDVVIAGEHVVLNPAYRTIGLFGSEYHLLSYPGRCGYEAAKRLIHDMLPIGPQEAERMGLVDIVLGGRGQELDDRIHSTVGAIIAGNIEIRDWKADEDLTLARLSRVKSSELGEMAKDFWSPRKGRFEKKRWDFVRKVVPKRTPLRFAGHRRQDGQLDEEESQSWDSVAWWETKQITDMQLRLQATTGVDNLRNTYEAQRHTYARFEIARDFMLETMISNTTETDRLAPAATGFVTEEHISTSAKRPSVYAIPDPDPFPKPSRQNTQLGLFASAATWPMLPYLPYESDIAVPEAAETHARRTKSVVHPSRVKFLQDALQVESESSPDTELERELGEPMQHLKRRDTSHGEYGGQSAKGHADTDDLKERNLFSCYYDPPDDD